MSWNGSGSNAPAAQPAQKPTAAKKSPSVVKGFVAGTVVVILAGVALYFISTSGSAKHKAGDAEKPTAVHTNNGATPKTSLKNSRDKKSELVDAKVASFVKQTAVSLVGTNVTANTNANDDIGIEVSKKVRQLGITAVDQLVNMATTAPTDIPPPPLPITSATEDEFRAMLKRPIEIKPDDTEEMKAIKQRMLDNRAALLSRLDEGYTVRDVLMQQQEMLAENAKIRMDVMKALKEFEDAGDAEGAELYKKKANEKLTEMGLEPVLGSNRFRDIRARRNKPTVNKEIIE